MLSLMHAYFTVCVCIVNTFKDNANITGCMAFNFHRLVAALDRYFLNYLYCKRILTLLLCMLLPIGSRSSARESKSTTLTVPEQQRTTHHRSRSVSPHRGDDQGRPRSRLPNVPLQR